MPEELEVPQPAAPAADMAAITNGTICIKIEKGRFGTKRKASTDDVSVASDKTLLNLSKTVLESPELKAVQQLDSEVSAALKRLALRSMFRGGVHLIPMGLVEEVDALMVAAAERRVVLVDAATATYDQRVQETAARLQVLSQPGDYPSKERFKSKFYFDWEWITWETPTKLKQIRMSLFESERLKAAEKLTAVANECRAAMREGLNELVEHMVDRLTPGDDGKKKIFNKKTIVNFSEFFRTFELKDVTGDTDLAAVATRAKAMLEGVDADSIRTNEGLRAAMLAQFQVLKAEMGTMVPSIGDRQIEFDDDDSE